MIHAAGDLDIARAVQLQQDPVAAGVAAVLAGLAILTVAIGIAALYLTADRIALYAVTRTCGVTIAYRTMANESALLK